MNLSELTRLLTQVTNDFATTLGVDPDRLAQEAAKVVPASFGGDPARELRRACETAARKISSGHKLERPGRFVVACLKSAVNVPDSPPPSSSASTRVDPFVLETIREIEEADAEIRRMPQARHDRVEAIERWRRDRFTNRGCPAPVWALYGFADAESYQDAQRKAAERWREDRGLQAPHPPGVQSLASLVHQSQTMRTLAEAIDGEGAE